MINRLMQIVDTLAGSYWFIPAVMALLAFVTALYLTQAQWVLDLRSTEAFAWAFNLQGEGARSIMATVAGSMITVAGVTFSITISSIVHATSQFGPRLLTNFMNDRGNQVTLGVFISTFLYCLVVLSSIPGQTTQGAPVVVPLVAVILGVALAIASVAVLIYFVHHVPASIHASHVIASVGKQLIEKVEKLYVETDESQLKGRGVPVGSHDNGGPIVHVESQCAGYLQFVDFEALIELAECHQLVLALNVSPGDFISTGDYIAWAEAELPPENLFHDEVREALLVGDRRTPAQDALFLANELIEISTRALSPGINDPFTAMMCTDWLGAAFAKVANRQHKQQLRHDEAGELRVVVPAASSLDFISGSLGKLMPYACKDRNALFHLQSVLAKLMVVLESDDMRDSVGEFADQLFARGQEYVSCADSELLKMRHDVIGALSGNREENAKIYNENPWIGRGV